MASIWLTGVLAWAVSWSQRLPQQGLHSPAEGVTEYRCPASPDVCSVCLRTWGFILFCSSDSTHQLSSNPVVCQMRSKEWRPLKWGSLTSPTAQMAFARLSGSLYMWFFNQLVCSLRVFCYLSFLLLPCPIDLRLPWSFSFKLSYSD